MMQLYLIAMHALFISSFLVSVTIVLKTKWWRYDVGINAFLFPVAMTCITFSILLQYYHILNQPAVYGWLLTSQLLIFALLFLWRFVSLLYYNWHSWAWSKDDSASEE